MEAHPPVISRQPRVAAGLYMGLLALGLCGCQASANMQLMERELRLQEQQIFELESHLEDCHQVAESYRRQVAELQEEKGDKKPATRSLLPNRPSGSPDRAPLTTPRVEDASSSEPALPNDLTLPSVDPGSLDADAPPSPYPGGESPVKEEPEGAAPEGEAPPFSPGAGSDTTQQNHTEELPQPARLGTVPPEGIFLTHVLSADLTPQQAPTFVLDTVVTPVDAAGDPLQTGGKVSFLLAPANGARGEHHARWDYSHDELAPHWKSSTQGEGLHFRLPWPGTPELGKYLLWVRLQAESGEKWLSSEEFEVTEDVLTQARLAAKPKEQTARQQVAGQTEGSQASPLANTRIAKNSPDANSEKPNPTESESSAWQASVPRKSVGNDRRVAGQNESEPSKTPQSPIRTAGRVPWRPHR